MHKCMDVSAYIYVWTWYYITMTSVSFHFVSLVSFYGIFCQKMALQQKSKNLIAYEHATRHHLLFLFSPKTLCFLVNKIDLFMHHLKKFINLSPSYYGVKHILYAPLHIKIELSQYNDSLLCVIKRLVLSIGKKERVRCLLYARKKIDGKSSGTSSTH